MSSNYDAASDDPLTIIRSLVQQDVPVKLIQPYRGLVLDQNVLILDVDAESAIVQATDLKMCAVLEGRVYLHGRDFPKPVVARVTDRNVRRGMVILSEFSYRDAEWKARKHDRVSQKDPTYVYLRWRGRTLRAPLENISANGMGVLVYKMVERGLEIEPRSKVQLDFQLPPAFRWNALKAKVVYLQSIGSSLVRLGLRLYPNVEEAFTLERFIARRKKEIMQEISEAYMERQESLNVTSQFF